MKAKYVLFTLVAMALAGGALYGMLKSSQQPNRIIQSSFGQQKIEIFDNSDTLSIAIAINDKGSVIGSCEQSDETGLILHTRYFFCNGDRFVEMPIPDEFTNVEAVAVSDNDVVVGFATRPIRSEGGSLKAVVWNPIDETMEFLPAAPGDSACQAQSISSDGLKVTGYSTGPERLRPVLWSRSELAANWEITVLPTVVEYNPYLMSSSLQISPDGKIIAACCTEKILPGNVHDSSLYVWQKDDNGQWSRRLLHEEQLYVRSLNNKGEIVGSVRAAEGRLPCYVSPDGNLQPLELLPGDVSGDARGINQSSQIVGWSDEPPGVDGGPKACKWTPEGVVEQVQLSEIPYSMIFGINDSGQMAGMLSVSREPRGKSSQDADEDIEVALAFRTIVNKASTK